MNTIKLPKAAITKMLTRAELAGFTTHQFGNDVVVSFPRSERGAIERVLNVQGFGYDVCVPHFSNQNANHRMQMPRSSARVIHVSLGVDDVFSSMTALIISFANR